MPIKPSLYGDMPRRLGLNKEQSVFNFGIGHVSVQDCTVNIVRGLEQGRLRDGDLMAIVGAGIGYVEGGVCSMGGERRMPMVERRTTILSFVIA